MQTVKTIGGGTTFTLTTTRLTQLDDTAKPYRYVTLKNLRDAIAGKTRQNCFGRFTAEVLFANKYVQECGVVDSEYAVIRDGGYDPLSIGCMCFSKATAHKILVAAGVIKPKVAKATTKKVSTKKAA